MLRINLIPPEKRVVRKTPLGIFLLFILGVGLFFSGAYLFIDTSLEISKAKGLQNDLEKEFSSLSERSKIYDSLVAESSSIKAAISSAEGIIVKKFYLSDILRGIHEAISSVNDVRIEKLEFLTDDIPKKDSPNHKFDIVFKGTCPSCFNNGIVNTEPLELLKRHIVANPHLKGYNPSLTESEPYKIMTDATSGSSSISYSFLLRGQ